VEQLGVERSRAALERAELTLVLIDGSRPWEEEDLELLNSASAHGPAVLVYTKADLPSTRMAYPPLPEGVPLVCLSAATGQGLD
jgi:tRNA modification GTPase